MALTRIPTGITEPSQPHVCCDRPVRVRVLRALLRFWPISSRKYRAEEVPEVGGLPWGLLETASELATKISATRPDMGRRLLCGNIEALKQCAARPGVADKLFLMASTWTLKSQWRT